MKTSMFSLVTAGVIALAAISCNHPKSELIVSPNQAQIDENVLEVSFALPNVGPTEGGMTIAIVGRYYHAGTQVYLDGIVCQNINIISSGYIQCQIPAHAAGAVNIRVDDPVTNLTVTVINGFTYLSRPFLTSVGPSQGPATGGTAVNLNGFNFANIPTVTFNGTPGVGITFVNSRLVTCTTPAGTVGPATVTITNPDTQFATMNPGFTYNYPPPNPTAINPITGDNMGGTPCTITGSWFQTGAGVKFGANQATNIVVVNSTTITCTSPNGPVYVPAQGVAITVTNPDLQIGVLSLAFTYFYANPAPTIISINPTSGPAAGGTPVTVTGTGFLAGAVVTFGLSPASNTVVVNPTTITCTTPSGGGTVSVTVTNPDTQFDTLTPGYTFVGGGGGGTPGNWVAAFNLDTTPNCDWWSLDFLHHWGLYEAALASGGIFTNGAAPTVDLLSKDKLGGQTLETCSVAYLRNANGTGVSGSSYNICFAGDNTKFSSWTILTDYSRIDFSDTDPLGGGAIGRAIYDVGNSGMEDNCFLANLGIFTGDLIAGWSTLSPVLTVTDQTYLDGTYVVGSGNDARYNQIQNYFQQLGMRHGFVVAHEIGHSVGLAHCTGSKCIENSVLNISGTFTNSWYYFCTAHKTQLGTNLGITPLYARETRTVYKSARDAAAVAKGVVTFSGPFGNRPDDRNTSEIRLSSVQCLRGSAPGEIRIMVEQPAEFLPPAGTEVLVFLAIPDYGQASGMGGYCTLRGGETGVVPLAPVMNPDAERFLASAALYADLNADRKQIVERLAGDFAAGGRLASDAVVALSQIEDAGKHMSADNREAFIDAFSSGRMDSEFRGLATHFVILMGRLGDARAIPALLSFLASQDSSGEGKNMADALCSIDRASSVSALLASLPGERPEVLARKLEVLGFTRANEANERAMAYMGYDDPAVRMQAIIAAGRTGSENTVAALRAVLDGKNSQHEMKLAVVALGSIPAAAGFPAIREAAASHRDPAVADFAAGYLCDPAGTRCSLVGGE